MLFEFIVQIKIHNLTNALSNYCLGSIQDFNLGCDLNISSSFWSIINVKKYNRQVFCVVLCLLQTNMLVFKRWALFLGTAFFEYKLKYKNYAIFNENFNLQLFLTIQLSQKRQIWAPNFSHPKAVTTLIFELYQPLTVFCKSLF